MQIKVMHREQCFAAAGGYGQEYNTESITIPTIIISISCLDKAIPNRLEKYRRENKNIINVAYVQFDDIDSSETVNGETPMSESDAKTIVDAFMKYKDRVEQIIVHCDAGYSRSPAVAAALAKALGMSDEVYFSSGQYCPNRHVYHRDRGDDLEIDSIVVDTPVVLKNAEVLFLNILKEENITYGYLYNVADKLWYAADTVRDNRFFVLDENFINAHT